ncbi:MAG: hypothetical protein ACOZNI_14510, partial [Myxococcota bacterium]
YNFTTPVVGADAGVVVPLKAGLGVLPYASLRADLRQTQISTPTTEPAAVSPIDVKAGLAVTWSPATR